MKDFFDDEDGGRFTDVDLCLGCGDHHFRESRVAGICVSCMTGDFDDASTEERLGSGGSFSSVHSFLS